MKIEQAINQDRFNSEYLKAVVNIAHINSLIENDLNAVLKKFDLSLQQFNILRILKGQKGKSVNLALIANRMVDRSSNVSRLLDKLVAKEMVIRIASEIDRRQKAVQITKKGLFQISLAIEELDAHVLKLNKVEKKKINHLNDILDELRGVILCI